MNPLSVLNGATRASGTGNDGRDRSGQDDSGAQAPFSRILDASQRANPQPRAQAPSARSEGPRRDSAKTAADDKDSGRDRPQARADETRARDEQPRARRDDNGKRSGPADAAQASGSDGDSAASESSETARDETAPADAWPPLGLGGIGLMLLQGTPPTATPDAASLASGGHAGTLPGPASSTPAALASSAAPATTGPGALPGLGATATLPTAAIAAATTADDTPTPQALAALAAASQAGAGDAPATDTAGSGDANTVFVLPTLAHAAPARVQDSGSVFTASPTPTPNLDGDGFDEAVGTRLTWLAEQKIGHAHIKITPNDLGPVEVSLQMEGDKIHASFSAAHADVRQALEHSLPRLRDMLGEHGFQLAHADVGSGGHGARGDSGGAATDRPGLGDTGGVESLSEVVPASVLKARGLLDAYA